MPRKVKPLPINLENIDRMVRDNAHRKETLLFFQRLWAVEDAMAKGEIPTFAGAMHSLKFLFEHREASSFSDEAYLAYVKRFEDGGLIVPVAWLRSLLEAWEFYIDPTHPVPLEKAAGLSGEGGSRKANTKINELTEQYYIADFVFREKLDAQLRGQLLSDDDAFDIVGQSFGKYPELAFSKGKIRDSWKRWGWMFKQIAELYTADQR